MSTIIRVPVAELLVYRSMDADAHRPGRDCPDKEAEECRCAGSVAHGIVRANGRWCPNCRSGHCRLAELAAEFDRAGGEAAMILIKFGPNN